MGVHTSARGFSLVESLLCLGLVGILGSVGLASMETRGPELTAVQQDLRGALEQAMHLSRASGRNISVGMRTPAGPDVLSVQAGPRIRWGKPAHVPLPPGMDDPVKADESGEAHPKIVVTPRRTATASTWFLHDGREAVCLRLSGHGHLTLLRWRADRKCWTRV